MLRVLFPRGIGVKDIYSALCIAGCEVRYKGGSGKADDVLRVLYPQGIAVEEIENALCIERIVDKICGAIANGAVGDGRHIIKSLL